MSIPKYQVPCKFQSETQRTTVKLFANFLKENDIKLHYLYNRSRRMTRKIEEIERNPREISDLFLYFSINGISCFSLVYSQLWRFYVLEHLPQYKWDVREVLMDILRHAIANNGTRDNKKVKKLFEKYKITPLSNL